VFTNLDTRALAVAHADRDLRAHDALRGGELKVARRLVSDRKETREIHTKAVLRHGVTVLRSDAKETRALLRVAKPDHVHVAQGVHRIDITVLSGERVPVGYHVQISHVLIAGSELALRACEALLGRLAKVAHRQLAILRNATAVLVARPGFELRPSVSQIGGAPVAEHGLRLVADTVVVQSRLEDGARACRRKL
jgi:hypothetical protein